MSEEVIQFELVSPEEKLVSEPVAMATLPGVEGEFGVGPDHASLVAALDLGTVELYFPETKDTRKIFITGGFADVTGSNCTVLAEEAADVATFNKVEIEKEIANLNEDLGLAKEEADVLAIEDRIIYMKAKLSAVTGKLQF